MTKPFALRNTEIALESGQKINNHFKQQVFIESFGVKIGIVSKQAEAIEAVRKTIAENFPACVAEIEETEVNYQYLLVWNKSEKDSLYKNGAILYSRTKRANLLDFFVSEIRRTIAEFAVGRVFVHSGAISWKGKAILFPAKSFHGKTSLTAAFVKRGAIYYSDEYAVLDDEGFVHSFAKPLSIRGEIDEYTQVEYPVEKLGGVAAREKTRVGMVLITEYKPSARWNPQILSPANGIMEIIKHTVPIRNDPAFALKVLDKVAAQALIVKSKRGDVSKSVDQILEFFEKNCL